MKQRENNKNVFDEIDRDIEQVKTTMKLFRHERILKKQIKILKGLTIIMFILSAILIYLGVFKWHKELNISLGTIGLFVSVYGLMSLKLISKTQTKTGDRR